MDTALARPESKVDAVEASEDETSSLGTDCSRGGCTGTSRICWLCLAACCLWHTDEAAELAPAQVSALRAEIEAYVAKVDLQGDLHQFELYFRFLETLLSDLSVPQLMLTVPPLEHVLDTGRVKSSGSGLWLEFGVATGQSIQMIARYGRRSSQDGPIKTVIGFDSFDGLPSAWSNHAKGTFARTSSAPPPLPPDCTNVTFVQGLFADSLPAFVKTLDPYPHTRVDLLHIDCDLYESTSTVLSLLSPWLHPGCAIVFDELVNYPGYEAHEARAFFEFLHRRSDLSYRCLGWRYLTAAVELTAAAS